MAPVASLQLERLGQWSAAEHPPASPPPPSPVPPGILARPLVAAEQRRAPAAAAQALSDLLGLAAEPKQPAQVGAGLGG